MTQPTCPRKPPPTPMKVLANPQKQQMMQMNSILLDCDLG
jgi:hypothetical protein